ncbi:hypothetical protein MNBD_PLANCTO03-1075 [hydrothermal vent metagenome]|uniref:phosphoglycerate mutase (2,3-diphosphoglycerate-dependent) n=1 Tax=hydrothermal vent metagenome TaxID=652676 RepID=A0A3B1E990_9ZZZZ
MAKSTHIKLLMVRAGASEWDLAGRLSGSADLPLSAEGMAAVQTIARELSEGSVCQIWTGPEDTAQATAQAIANATGSKLKVVPALHEVGVGLWEGLNCADAEERAGKAFRQWREDPASVVPPGGEPITEAAERVIGQVRALLAKARGDENCGVCLVLRPMVFGIVRCWLRGEDLAAMWTEAQASDNPEWMLVDRDSVRTSKEDGPATVRCAS